MGLSSVVYNDDGVVEYRDLEEAKAAQGTTWVRVTEASPEDLDQLAATFGLHQLAIEDVVNSARPKTEEFATYTFVLIKTAELSRGETSFDEEIQEEPVGVFIGTDWVLTLALGSDEPIDRVWRAVARGDERLLHRGPDFTAYRVMDVVVDEYFELLDGIEDQIESIEEQVLYSTGIETVEAINGVRRDLLSFRRLTWPSREALGSLARGDPPQIQAATEKYYRDVYEHLVQVVELTEIYRDLASGARDIYLNSVSQSTNEVMKALTIVATVFLPLTFVVGIYGMNFEGGPLSMPELGWTFAYPAVMVGMALVALILLVYFRRMDFL